MDSTARFLENEGLYAKVEVVEETFNDLSCFYNGYDQIEVFCPQCEKDRLFYCTGYEPGQSEKDAFTELFTDEPQIKQFNFACTKDNDHKLYYTVMCHKDGDKKYLTKIGQFPSYADLARPIFLKYKKLKNNYYMDLNRATGLFDSGIGIGSYIYLRRIIEKLIAQAGNRAIEDKRITSEQFEYRRTDDDHKIRNGVVEKIKILKGYLPDIMVEAPQIYSIVSKGVHELSEEECKKYFMVLKNGIQMILDDMLAQQQRSEDEKNYKAELGTILHNIK